MTSDLNYYGLSQLTMPMCRDDIKSEKFLKLNEWVRNKRIMIDVIGYTLQKSMNTL